MNRALVWSSVPRRKGGKEEKGRGKKMRKGRERKGRKGTRREVKEMGNGKRKERERGEEGRVLEMRWERQQTCFGVPQVRQTGQPGVGWVAL